MVSVCHMILLDRVTKGLSNSLGGRQSMQLIILPGFFSHKYYGIGDGTKEFVSLTVVAMEKKKRHYFSYHSNSCNDDKISHQKHESFTFELPLIKLRYIFSQRVQNFIKKNFMTVVHNCNLKIETDWALKFIYPILQTGNVSLYMYAHHTFLDIK